MRLSTYKKILDDYNFIIFYTTYFATIDLTFTEIKSYWSSDHGSDARFIFTAQKKDGDLQY